MSLFDAFIQNLKQKVDAGNAYKQPVIEVVKEIIGVTLAEDSVVSLKEGTLTLRISPTLKSALLLKKEKLLAEFSKRDIKVFTIR